MLRKFDIFPAPRYNIFYAHQRKGNASSDTNDYKYILGKLDWPGISLSAPEFPLVYR